MVGQYEELSCPFCDKGALQALHVLGAWSVRRTGRTSLPGKQRITKSSDAWIIQSGCRACGRSAEEVERRLKEDGVI